MSLLAVGLTAVAPPTVLPGGMTLHVGSILGSVPGSSTPSGTVTYSLPLPPGPEFCGLTVYVQGFHTTTAGWVSSSGLAVTIQ